MFIFKMKKICIAMIICCLCIVMAPIVVNAGTENGWLDQEELDMADIEDDGELNQAIAYTDWMFVSKPIYSGGKIYVQAGIMRFDDTSDYTSDGYWYYEVRYDNKSSTLLHSGTLNRNVVGDGLGFVVCDYDYEYKYTGTNTDIKNKYMKPFGYYLHTPVEVKGSAPDTPTGTVTRSGKTYTFNVSAEANIGQKIWFDFKINDTVFDTADEGTNSGAKDKVVGYKYVINTSSTSPTATTINSSPTGTSTNGSFTYTVGSTLTQYYAHIIAVSYTGKVSGVYTMKLPIATETRVVKVDANGGKMYDTSGALVSSKNKTVTISSKTANQAFATKETDSSSVIGMNAFVTKPVREGYRFKGWEISSPANSGMIINNNATIGANYNGSDGSMTYFYGYSLTGTWCGADASTIVISAIWDVNTATLHYNANGGKVTTDKTYTVSGKGYLLQSDGTEAFKLVKYNDSDPVNVHNMNGTFGVTRTGYHLVSGKEYLVGSATSTTTIDHDSAPLSVFQSYIKNGDVTVNLFANWELNQSTLTIDPNGGSWNGKTTKQSFTQNYNTTKTIADPTREGYTFAGWEKSSTFTAGNLSGKTFTFGSTNGGTGTLTATWEPNTLTMYYNANGGSISTDKASTYYLSSGNIYKKSDSTIFIQSWTYNNAKTNGLANASSFGLYKTGYTLSGWKVGSSGTTIFDQNDATLVPTSFTSSIKDGNTTVTMYAVWTPNVYKITLDNQSATTAGTTAYYEKYNTGNYTTSSCTTSISKITIPTKTGYTFGGYYTSTNGSGTQYVDANGNIKSTKTTFTSNTTLYAKWTPNKVILYYNVNGGIITTDKGYPVQSDGFMLLKDKSGKAFIEVSWTSADPIDVHNMAGTFGVTKEGYHLKSGAEYLVGSKTATTTIDHDSAPLSLFKEYMKNSNGTLDLYANWLANTYTVKYDSNKPSTASGVISGTMSSSTHTYDTSKKLTANKYSLTGYAFNGWNTKADGSGTYYSDQQSVKNLITTNNGTVTLYAQWKVNTYTVKYNSNKPSTASGVISGTMSNSTHTYDLSSNLSANKYSLKGWTFTGWNTKADGSGTSYSDKTSVKNLTSTANGTVTLYAQWTANTYTIIYDGNGATSGSTASSSHTYDTAKKLTASGFIKIGYTFTGWNTKPDGSGTSYSDQQSVKNLTSTNNGTVTLYAQWSKPLTLTFNMNGGLYDQSNQSIVLSGTVYNNQTEYTFNINGATTPAKEYTYSAQTNTIQAYGTVTSNGLNSLLTKKDIDGTLYRFLGWSTDKSATVPQEPFNTYNTSHNLTYIINTSTTLYAIWEPVLIVQLKSERVLGSLASLVDIPKSTVMASYKTNVANINGSVVTTARAGEAIRYIAQHRGNLNSLQVTFDPYITNIYDYNNPVYADTLNKITIENAGEVIPSEGYTVANSSLNRLIQNPLSQITRIYSLPLYLGSERAKEASHKATRYYVDYIFTNSNSFYYQYTQSKPEVITIRQIIILSTNENGLTESVLEELKTKLKIRLR